MPTLARLLCIISAAPTFDIHALQKLARLRPNSSAAPPNDNSALAQLKLVLALVLEALVKVRLAAPGADVHNDEAVTLGRQRGSRGRLNPWDRLG